MPRLLWALKSVPFDCSTQPRWLVQDKKCEAGLVFFAHATTLCHISFYIEIIHAFAQTSQLILQSHNTGLDFVI